MLEYALSRYHEYIVLFYAIVVIIVLLEGPITIMTLTMLAPQLWLPLEVIFLLSMIGDFGGDYLHFLVGRYGKKLLKKQEENPDSPLNKVHKQLEKYPLLEKLIIIKYTPPISNVGLIYLGTSPISTKAFLLKTLPLCTFSSILVISLGHYFGNYFQQQENLAQALFWIGITIVSVLFILRLLGKRLVKKVNEKYN